LTRKLGESSSSGSTSSATEDTLLLFFSCHSFHFVYQQSGDRLFILFFSFLSILFVYINKAVIPFYSFLPRAADQSLLASAAAALSARISLALSLAAL
jgi:hypothetical protein